jgi:hypothetical protein
MMEAGVVLGLDNKPLYWHTPNERSGGALPDSRALWDFIWENRQQVTGFAHTHPGSGVPGPSHTDITTFVAIEAALGKHLNWFILSSDNQVLVLEDTDDNGDCYFVTVELNTPEIHTPKNTEWMTKLRELSHYQQ